jgi:ribosomal RNA assembly protein
MTSEDKNTPKTNETLLDINGNPITNKNKRYRKDKPWDNDPTLDKWKVEEFKPEDNPIGMVDESSFSVLFPQYREKYIKEIWPLLKNELKRFNIVAELNLIEGSMTVKT